MQDFFRYFQLIALTVFLTVFIGRSVYLRSVQKINPFALGVGKKGLRRFVEIGFLFGFVAWLLEVIASPLQSDWRVFPGLLQWQVVDSKLLRVTGAVMVVAGIAVFVSSLISFGTSWRVGIDQRAPGRLVTTGIFALSRNPIFVCLALYAFGTFLLNGTLGFLIFAVVLAIGVHYQILQEENFLRRAYGTAYQRYCDRTARYFGWRSLNRSGRSVTGA